MDYSLFIISTLQFLALLVSAPAVVGLIRLLKARAQGRRGASLLQPYRDLRKLWRKDEQVSEDASWLFRVAPLISAASVILTTSMLPVLHVTVLGPGSDMILAIYILMLSRAMLVLSSLEGGSVFGGMGGSRDSMISVLIEPALLLSIFSLAALAGSTELSSTAQFISQGGYLIIGPTLILAAASFCITTLAENARLPFDNPATHLELTMVHEAMVLEYSGRSLALMEYSSWLKLTVFITILVNGFLPWGISSALDPLSLALASLAFIFKLILALGLIALLESQMAKMRLFRLPNLLTTSFTLALLALMAFYIL
ncbi:MAG: NADH-quinone oxidoreductase subunit H [Candidatus Methanomethylophilaceae archaeon]|nr:NADH-quinone oxidoreductase subunit H [Candidatus Methanomethylophilaceae archaeon]